jgi:hypothetical protein
LRVQNQCITLYSFGYYSSTVFTSYRIDFTV